MPGALGAVAVVGVAAALTVGLAAVGSAAVFGQRLAGAADAAALALCHLAMSPMRRRVADAERSA